MKQYVTVLGSVAVTLYLAAVYLTAATANVFLTAGHMIPYTHQVFIWSNEETKQSVICIPWALSDTDKDYLACVNGMLYPVPQVRP